MQRRVSCFRVVTYNLHKGFSGSRPRRFVLHQMRHALAGLDADFVLLQEVLGEHRGHARREREWPEEPQFEFLADSLWPHHAYGRNAVYDAGNHGNAILSRAPLGERSNIPVSPYPFAASRSLLHGVARIPDTAVDLHLICVHFGFLSVERRPQIAKLCAHIDSAVPADAPLLVAGDFNDWSARAERHFNAALSLTEAHRALHGQFAHTYPAWSPLLPLDRIYVRGLEIRRAERLAGAPWRSLSDHVPLIADLALCP